MHDESIMHSDIRPENIMLDKDDGIKIVDLRVNTNKKYVKAHSKEEDFPYYLAPEVLSKNSKSVKESDIWAVGVLFYNLLSGKQPFAGDTYAEVENNVKNKIIKFNHVEFDLVSDDAKDLILKLLEKNPAQRINAQDALDHDWFKK